MSQSPQLSEDACYRALSARDARFDGVFFVAVKTTGVYCRPICPARTPGRTRHPSTRPISSRTSPPRASRRAS
jgi:methylphosphotriester-DNA--protein-cysteine methyltransferase